MHVLMVCASVFWLEGRLEATEVRMWNVASQVAKWALTRPDASCGKSNSDMEIPTDGRDQTRDFTNDPVLAP